MGRDNGNKMSTTLPILSVNKPTTDRTIANSDEVRALLSANAPVAIGVSGGKDSCAVAIAYSKYLKSIKHAGKVILIHSDLGRVEWADSLPTCERLARHLNLELIVVRRAAGDMMDRWLTRWRNNVDRYVNLRCVKLILPWSTPSMRFCTSELKTAVICRELIRQFPGNRIISVSGIRREESSARAKAPVTKEQLKLRSVKHGTTGLDVHPIIDWTIGDVFAVHEEADFRPHEAYTKHGSSRVSCRFCIMGSAGDLQKSAQVTEHATLYREMVELEINSTFAFQGGKWLGDVAPSVLSDTARATLQVAKQKAIQRTAIEEKIPKNLWYVKGWPTCVPTLEEAEILAMVRVQVGTILNLPVRFTTAESVIARYQELIEESK